MLTRWEPSPPEEIERKLYAWVEVYSIGPSVKCSKSFGLMKLGWQETITRVNYHKAPEKEYRQHECPHNQ
ncbi:hypothetical protein HI914_02319 [Erysiphe necator]|nr:hypothetical protein HI914_02319 [Erysiphe necator]